MPFTGRIGTDDSQLGNVVLGIVDQSELNTLGLRAHALTSRQVRVLFDLGVTGYALDPAAYALSAVTPGAYVPTVSSVSFYDAGQTSVVLELSDRLTWTAIYSVQASGLVDFGGRTVSGLAVNFTANVQDPPRAVAAYLGRSGTVDIVFDRAVGPYSPAAVTAGDIRAAGSFAPGDPTDLLDWAVEGVPDNVVRYEILAISFPAGSYDVGFAGAHVFDVAGNDSGAGTVPLTMRLRLPAPPGPYSAAQIARIQFIDAWVTDVAPFANFANVRVFFNVPALASDVTDPLNWQVNGGAPGAGFATMPAGLGPITDHASPAGELGEEGLLRYFADLRVTCSSAATEIRIQGTIAPDGGGAPTSTGDASGDITARAASEAAVVQWSEVTVEEGVRVLFDRPVAFSDPPLSVALPGGSRSITASFELATTLGDLWWAFNDLVYAYSEHIGVGGAGHVVPEAVYIVHPYDYLSSPDLATAVIAANDFKAKLDGHVQGTVHTSPGEPVAAPDATDLPSLTSLVEAMRSAFTGHNSSGRGLHPLGVVPAFPGRHTYPGLPVMVANPWTVVAARFAEMVDGGLHTVFGGLEDLRYDPAFLRVSAQPLQLSAEFTGVAYRPSLAAALPFPGLALTEDFSGAVERAFVPDVVEVYFSKPMYRADLMPVATSPVQITGSIVQSVGWKDDWTVSAAVSGMAAALYTVSVSGLTDEAGNAVYP